MKRKIMIKIFSCIFVSFFSGILPAQEFPTKPINVLISPRYFTT